MEKEINKGLPEKLADLKENREFVADVFRILESYIGDMLYTQEMKNSLENFKWDILGNFDADISYIENMQDKEFWEGLTRIVRAN